MSLSKKLLLLTIACFGLNLQAIEVYYYGKNYDLTKEQYDYYKAIRYSTVDQLREFFKGLDYYSACSSEKKSLKKKTSSLKVTYSFEETIQEYKSLQDLYKKSDNSDEKKQITMLMFQVNKKLECIKKQGLC